MKNNCYLHNDITSKIISAFYRVYNTLGFGFLEKVYENAIAIELLIDGLNIKTQRSIKVYYKGKAVGFYVADIIVNDYVIVEIKSAEAICEEHEAQLLNYLKATDIEVGLLLNFGKRTQIKRKVYSEEFKPQAIKKPSMSET